MSLSNLGTVYSSVAAKHLHIQSVQNIIFCSLCKLILLILEHCHAVVLTEKKDFFYLAASLNSCSQTDLISLSVRHHNLEQRF